MSADPLHPDFEDRLQHLEPVLDCLLSVDHFVCPKLNPEHSRRAFDALARKADAALAAGLTHKPPPILEAEAACAFLRTLRADGFAFRVLPRSPTSPDPKLISGALVDRSGCCATFSLLLVAYLDRHGIRAAVVCMPDHCFVRVATPDRQIDVECTDFDSPLRDNYAQASDFHGAAAEEGGHYGRPLSLRELLWHYYVDRLWKWTPWADTDDFCLRSLERARTILGSACRSIEAHEAFRYSRRVAEETLSQGQRRRSWSGSYERYLHLSQWHRGESEYASADLEGMRPLAWGQPDDRRSLASGSGTNE